MMKPVILNGVEYLVEREGFAGEIAVGRRFEIDGKVKRHAVTIRDDGKMSDHDAAIAMKPLLDVWEEMARGEPA